MTGREGNGWFVNNKKHTHIHKIRDKKRENTKERFKIKYAEGRKK